MVIQRASVDLFWLPLGAGGHSVRAERARLRAHRRESRSGVHALRSLPLGARVVCVPRAASSSSRRQFASRTAASRGVVLPRGRSVCVASGEMETASATSFAGGPAGRYPMSTRRLRARDDSATDPARRAPAARVWRPTVPRSNVGAATNRMRARCGTRTPSIAWLLARSGVDAAAIRPPGGWTRPRLGCRSGRSTSRHAALVTPGRSR